jgi:hypothetical protein
VHRIITVDRVTERVESSPLISIEPVALRACRRVPDRRHAVKPARFARPSASGH